jgi:hypothetical protein
MQSSRVASACDFGRPSPQADLASASGSCSMASLMLSSMLAVGPIRRGDCARKMPDALGLWGRCLARGGTAKRCRRVRSKLLQQAVRRLSIARAHSIGQRMSTANHDVATGRKDVAHGVASRKNPGVQDGIVDPTDEGGI